MSKRYNPEGYDKNKKILEKFLFSLPEYLIFETKLGGWFSFQLQRILGWLNVVSIKKIPKTRDNLYRKMMEYATDIITRILSWVSYFVEKRKKE